MRLPAPVLLLTGLPGSGKTTLARGLMLDRLTHGIAVEVIDGDSYREALCSDLGFSRADRIENNRRIGFVAGRLSLHGIVVIIASIAPYKEGRDAIRLQCPGVKVVHVSCPMEELFRRDPKGHYRRATLPKDNPAHIPEFTGVSAPYEPLRRADLVLDTYTDSQTQCLLKLRALLEDDHV